MANWSSQQDQDGVTWQTAPLALGSYGVDLRRPAEPPALAKLLNARFLDERTLQRRSGFIGSGLVDADAFPAGGSQISAGAWVYGHGHPVTSAVALPPNVHYPIARRGQGIFSFNGDTVVWTGDRLLVTRSDGTALGDSLFWSRARDVATNGGLTDYSRGIPAHLPLMTDEYAPVSVTGNFVETCLTADLRLYACIHDNRVIVVVISRSNNTIISVTNVAGTSVAPCEPVLLVSGGVPVILFRDTTDQRVRFRSYTSVAGWTTEDFITPPSAAVSSYDVAQDIARTGFTVVWRAGSTLSASTYSGLRCITANVGLPTASAPTGVVGCALSPVDDHLGVVYDVASGMMVQEFTTANVSVYSESVAPMAGQSAARGASIVARQMADDASAAGRTEWVVHAGYGGINVIYSTSFTANSIGATRPTVTRYNCDLVSKGFAIGDEVFAWYRARNSGSCFLLAGCGQPYVAGWADREIGVTPNVPGAFNYWPTRLSVDPADASGATVTWTRRFNVGTNFGQGNVVTGSLNFLPQLSTATYGKSVYLSGSCVKNWDGRMLADAGFMDYPTTQVSTQNTGGQLTVGGTYSWRVYAVRYNEQGERFESAAVTFGPYTLSASNTLVNLNLLCTPATSTNDVTLEVYRTENLGTTFYLEGTATNDNTAAQASFTSSMSDALLRDQKGDPHAPGVGNLADLETFAPLGCAFLAVVGDRLWGAGGQVPQGVAQFSKLAVQGFGAGFDDLAGYVVVSNEGGNVTSIVGNSGAVVLFQPDRIYVVEDTGPDNFGSGSFSAPQLRLVAGAITHFGTALTQDGPVYWGVDGPLLLTNGYDPVPISAPVRPLTEALTPTAVQVDPARQEVIWYCGTTAVLMNYMIAPRWAVWSTPNIVSGTNNQLVTSDGRVLVEDSSAMGDDGVPFEFTLRTGNVRADQVLAGAAQIREVGVVGVHDGDHQLRIRAYYDGAPMWTDEFVWQPETGTWLTSVNDVGSLTPAQVDAAYQSNRAGAYVTSHRLKRQVCHHVSVEISDISSWTPTFTPFELAFELANRPGLGRVAVNTFGD